MDNINRLQSLHFWLVLKSPLKGLCNLYLEFLILIVSTYSLFRVVTKIQNWV